MDEQRKKPSAKKRTPKADAPARAERVERVEEPTPPPRPEPPRAGFEPLKLAGQVAFIAVAFVCVFGFVRAARKDEKRSLCGPTCAMTPAYAGRDRRAPDFTLKDLDGNSVSLSSYRGKTVVLNFWASWCDPCREEMPSLAKLAVMLKDRPNVVLLTISVDEEADAITDTLKVLLFGNQEVKSAIPDGKIPFPVLRDPDLKVTRDVYGTTAYPETWIIDKEGFVRMRYDGAFDWSSAIAVEAIENASRGTGCLTSFDRGKPTGPELGLCESE